MVASVTPYPISNVKYGWSCYCMRLCHHSPVCHQLLPILQGCPSSIVLHPNIEFYDSSKPKDIIYDNIYLTSNLNFEVTDLRFCRKQLFVNNKFSFFLSRNQPSEGELQVPYWKCKQSTLTPQKQVGILNLI